MKFRGIMIITLFLAAIMMLGTAYAAEDALTVETDMEADSLALDDEVQLESSDINDQIESINEEKGNILESSTDSSILNTYDNEKLQDYDNQIHISGSALSDITDAIVSSPENTIFFLDGKTYSGTSTMPEVTLNNIWIHGGSFIGDTEMATFSDDTINFMCQGTVFNNCKFSNFISSGRLANMYVSYNGATFSGSMTNTTFENCQSYTQFISFLGNKGDAPYIYGETIPIEDGWTGMAYKIYNCNFTNCRHNYDDFEDGHGQFIAGTGGVEIDSCNFINTTSGHHGGAICISDETKWNPNYIASSIRNTNFIGVNSKWFAVYIHGPYQDAPYSGLYGHHIVENCTFVNCTASEEYGACIGISHDDVLVTGCTFINNTGGQGTAIMIGGISQDSTTVDHIAFDGDNTKGNNISIVDCRFINNTAAAHECLWPDSSSSGNGGAIYICGNYTTISGCLFDNNTAVNGSAIYIYGVNTTITDSNFYNNDASYGALYCKGNNVTIVGSIFENCSADEGGAIYFDVYAYALVQDSTFTNNTALDGNGGAIYSKNVNAIVNYSSFNENTASSTGSAMYNCEYDDDCTFEGNSFPDSYSSDKKDSELSIISSDVTYGEDATVIVAINSDAVGNVNLNCDGVNYTVVMVEGVGSIALPGLNIGTHDIIARYDGDENYNPSMAVSTIMINKPETIFNLTVEDNEINQTTRITVDIAKEATGDISIELSNKSGIIRNITAQIVDGQVVFEFSDLDINLYDISIHYSGDGIYDEVWKNTSFSVLPTINMPSIIKKGLNGHVVLEFGEVTGFVNFYIDEKSDEKLKIRNGAVNYTLETGDLSIGSHIITFEYLDGSIDSDIFKYSYRNFTFDVVDGYVPEEDVSKEYFEVHLESDAKGTVEFFLNGTKVAVAEVVNGVARLDISKFKNGNYLITWRYSGDDKYSPYGGSYRLLVNIKPAKIAASDFSIVYTANDKYSVKVYDSKGKLMNGVQVSFLINNKAYKTVKTDANGIARVAISKVPGSYKITAKVSGLSVTKKLTVKHIVSLKKVKVKRSLKKLIIKVTLKKVNGKYLKKKKVTLKFNGKKYKAKTNKKGVAKFTIKSKVLKKLKAGKKVKYQATYLKDTVKKTERLKNEVDS